MSLLNALEIFSLVFRVDATVAVSTVGYEESVSVVGDGGDWVGDGLIGKGDRIGV